MHPSAVTNHAGLGKSYSYDANGNMLTRGNQTLTWDIDNRVSSIAISGGGSTSMEYDYAGVRVKKNAPAGITLYPFAGYEIDPNGVITKFIRIGIENFASKKGTNKYFYHNDHLESVNVITDIAGTRVQLNEYDPWGTVSRSEGAIDPAHRFTGQKLDPETGLYYYGGRYYDAEIGRFISADPFVQTPLDPQNLNRYSYVVNNPQNYIDPDGYFHRHKKKKGGFFSRFFGIFSIIIGIVTLQPELAAIGAAETFSVTNILIGLASIGRGISDLASLESGAGGIGPPGGINDIGIQLAAANITNGFFSPALRLAAETGSDSTWDLLRILVGVADAAEFPKGSRGGLGARKRFSRGVKQGARTGTCLYCGDATTQAPGPNKSEIDHVISRAQGGNNTPPNSAEACLACNRDKGPLTSDQYLERLKNEQVEINRINKLPPGERAGPLREIFRKRWQTLQRWGGGGLDDE
jgi:RHS repeat-associated protein